MLDNSSMSVFKIQVDQEDCKDASNDDNDDHGDVNAEVDHHENVSDDGSVLGHFAAIPNNLIRDASISWNDPGQIVSLLVIEGDNFVGSLLELFQLGPRDSVTSVLIKSHSTLD